MRRPGATPDTTRRPATWTDEQRPVPSSLPDSGATGAGRSLIALQTTLSLLPSCTERSAQRQTRGDNLRTWLPALVLLLGGALAYWLGQTGPKPPEERKASRPPLVHTISPRARTHTIEVTGHGLVVPDRKSVV